LLIESIRKYVPEKIRILEQGEIVAEKLVDYLKRHVAIQTELTKNGEVRYQTTESAENFESKAALFMGKKVKAEHIRL
jgi:glutamate racemase